MSTRFSLSMEMSRLTRDGTAKPVWGDQFLRRELGQINMYFPCSADHEQDWQPYPVDPTLAICDDHTYILYRPRDYSINFLHSRRHIIDWGIRLSMLWGFSADKPL